MAQQSRFGRRLPLPSTTEIKHELRLMAAADAIRTTLAGAGDAPSNENVDTIIDDLARSCGITPACARMLAEHVSRADALRENATQ